VKSIADEILVYVNARDKRFRKQPLNVGSYYSNLKVSAADEFDFSVILDMSNFSWCYGGSRLYGFDDKKNVVGKAIALPSPPPGQCFSQIGNLKREWVRDGLEKGDWCLTYGDDIVPIKVKRHFKKLVAEAVNQPKFSKMVSVSKLSDSPATKLTITDPGVSYSISVDLCPMIETKLPFRNEFGFPRPNREWHLQKK